ncbi:MAG: Gfo/Idh/MocA family oxidoreductase [Verrucomicrobiota bacterium]
MKTTTRRSFIKTSALFAGMPMIIPASVLGQNGKVAPSNRITVGGIGLGGRGRKVLDAFFKHSDFQFLAIADPQKERREIVQRTVTRKHGQTQCDAYADMGDVLSRDDIDAVIIATGDRWHTTASIYAARAGKDIYCEKPCSMNIQESRELDEEIKKHKRVFQAGTQRRSVPNFALAAELAQTGKLGKLKAVHAGILNLQEYKEPLPGEPLPDPAVIDWDKWVGPAPMVPYNRDYCRGKWRNHEGFYAAYRLPEWGSHTVDLCQWAADADGTSPVEYEADGSTIEATYENGVKLVMRLAGFKGEGDWIEGLGSCPVRFEGDNGWVEAGDFQKIEASDPGLITGKTYNQLRGTDPVDHARNFLDCVKSRKQPICNSTVARYGHMTCFAAAASWKLGKKVTFDPVKESFPNNDEATDIGVFSYTRRKGYTI